MKKYIVVVVFIISLYSCKSGIGVQKSSSKPVTTMDYKEQIENLEQRIYFRASGEEGDWNLKISENSVQFTSKKSGFEFVGGATVAPERAMDVNIKKYNIVTASGAMNIEILQEDCSNKNTRGIAPYKVKIEFIKKSSNQSTVFNGCGAYITDYRLHDIWVLEKMNGEKTNKTKFKGEFPRIEIYSAANTFFGFGGCNNINGSLFFEDGLLRFTDVISTLMACEPQNAEDEFLNSLQSIVSYSVENNKLILKNESGIELVFQKVD
jgi:heat shock protein HslJ